MKHNVLALRRADNDVRQITRWISRHSRQGADAWLDAYEQLLEWLAEHAESCPAAGEDSDCSVALREAFFGTGHGRAYRTIFTIVGEEVRILRVRGPGQPPLQDGELL